MLAVGVPRLAVRVCILRALDVLVLVVLMLVVMIRTSLRVARLATFALIPTFIRLRGAHAP